MQSELADFQFHPKSVHDKSSCFKLQLHFKIFLMYFESYVEYKRILNKKLQVI